MNKPFVSSMLACALLLAAPAKANDVIFFDKPPTADEILHSIGLGQPQPAAAAAPRSSESRPKFQGGKDRSISLVGTNQRLDQPAAPPLATTQSFKTESPSLQPELLGDKWFAELIQFTKNNHNVRSSQMGVIARVAEVLQRKTDLRIIVSGHADSSGNDQINRPLSERRAAAVRAMLQRDFGIPTARISIRAASADEPLSDLVPSDPRNRRVQFGFQR